MPHVQRRTEPFDFARPSASRHGRRARDEGRDVLATNATYASGKPRADLRSLLLDRRPVHQREERDDESSSDQCAAIANPAAMRKLPKYSGFRVCAYGPVVARRSFLTMCPAAQARITSPTNASAAPTPNVSGDGRGPNTRYSAARMNPSGSRSSRDLLVAQSAISRRRLPRNHEALDLGRALADLADLRVAHHPLDRIVLACSRSRRGSGWP